MCQEVVENYLETINACNTSCRGHLNDVVWFTHNVNVQTLQKKNKKKKNHEKSRRSLVGSVLAY